MNHKHKILGSIFIMLFIWSCKKNYLDKQALGTLDESELATKSGVDRLLIGAYAMLDGISFDFQNNNGVFDYGNGPSNWIYGSICGSEAYTGSQQTDQPDIRNIETFNSLPSNHYFNSKWIAIYAGVARANTVLRVMKKATNIKADDQKRIEGESKFLRAVFHFEALKMWNKVPFVDETITYEAQNYYVNNDTLIWGAIENDLKFAMTNLPSDQIANGIGRANSYAAEAFLAKAYMFEHRYADAKPLLQDLISNGQTAGGMKYGLLKHFADNFNAETKNREESVFAVQMSVNDGADVNGGSFGGFNGNIGDELNFPQGNNSLTPCCGFFQPSQWLVNHFKTDAFTGLPDLNNFNNVDVKNDSGITSDKPFIPDSGTFDPRLDWTVGRRGISYLDWGIHPGNDWIRDQNYSGPYSPKKNVFYKSQAGNYSFGGGWVPMANAINVNMIRYADILLWAAEAEIETGNPDNARSYVNQIRARGGDPTGWVYTYIDPNDPSKGYSNTPAANYKIGLYTQPWSDEDFARKAVRYERVLELAMEGHRFFDIVRWGIADQEANAYLQKEQLKRTYMKEASFTKNKNEYFPIPQTQIDLSIDKNGVKHLTQNPNY